MCGRYTVFTDAEIAEMNAIIAEIGRLYGDSAVSAIKRGEVYPTNTAPILSMEGSALSPRPSKWGFPKWDGKGVIINAKAETVQKLPTFSNTRNVYRSQPPEFVSPIDERRCVIPSTGFYEWKHVDGKSTKEKYLLRFPDSDMLYMAGIANVFQDAAGQPFETFCILTTAASRSVAEVHNRMPVILKPCELEMWLKDKSFMVEALARDGPELLLTKAA